MKIIRTHIIPDDIEQIRLEDYIRIKFPFFPSRKGVQKSIKRGQVLLDNNKTTPGTWLKPGQRIDWLELEKTVKEYPMKMEVIFEDDYLAIINKPAGIIVSGNKHRTVVNALGFFLKPSSKGDKLTHPQPAHRLDAQTSGLLLVGKTSSALIFLNKLFESKQIIKEYTAIVQGEIPKYGIIDTPVDGKKSKTKYNVKKYSRSLNNKWVSLVSLTPKTGRTHQLRIHLSDFGFPIVGDRIYGTEGNILKGKGLFLCATALKFNHPFTKEQIVCEIDPPEKFEQYMYRERKRWEYYESMK